MTTSKSLPAVGKQAPNFAVLDDRSQRVSLADFKGKPVVLYCYPVEC